MHLSIRLLEYFGEIFSSSECKASSTTACDNCRQIFQTSAIDCTRMSVEILKLVSELAPNYLTVPYIIDILRGVQSKTIRDAGHHRLRAFNSCPQMTRLGPFELLIEIFSLSKFRSRTIDLKIINRWIFKTRIPRTTVDLHDHCLSSSRKQCSSIDQYTNDSH